MHHYLTNPVPRLVYADWLDEQGNPRGELLRIQEELRHLNVPRRAEKERRMHELLNEGVEPLVITHTSSIGMQGVLIFPGEFLMGSQESRWDNETQVETTISQAFWLGQSAVTQRAWQQIKGSQPWKGEGYVLDDPDCPATFVSWEDAVDFCRKLTEQEHQLGRLPETWEYRLPTEAQWEYSCRAGTTSRYSFGEEDSELDLYAWFDKTSLGIGESYAHPVGQKQPNPWGLSDMHGNVWEWCRDWYGDKLPDECDPESPTEGSDRVERGGGWYDSARDCRSAYRDGRRPSNRVNYLGFRVARDLSRQ